MPRIEGAEPVADVVEEGIPLQLREGAHVYVGSLHLPFGDFAHALLQSALVHPLLPVGIDVVSAKVLLFDVGHTAQLGVLHQFGDDLLAHLTVYLLGVGTAGKLQYDVAYLAVEYRVIGQ